MQPHNPNEEQELLRRAAQLEETLRQAQATMDKLAGNADETTPISSSNEPKKRGWWEKHKIKKAEKEAYEEDGERQRETMPTPDENSEIEKELNALPEKERATLMGSLLSVGFKVEKLKNDFFAKTFGFFVKKDANQDKYTTRFLKELADSFKRDAKNADQRAQDLTNGQGTWSTKLMSQGALVGNIFKYGRMVTDITGKTMGMPLRYMTMAGMAVSRASEAGKEAHLKTEETSEKTRIKNSEEAAEQAWVLYEEALARSGGKISEKELQNAYVSTLPKELLKRLGEPATASLFFKNFVKWDITKAVERLNKNIQKIEENKKYTAEEKEAKKLELLNGMQWKNALRDYDRMITNLGTVDKIAMGAIYTKAVGRGMIGGALVGTIGVSLEKLWEAMHKPQVSMYTEEQAKVITAKWKHAMEAKIASMAPHEDSAQMETTPLAQQVDTTASANLTEVKGAPVVQPDSVVTKVLEAKPATGVDTTATGAVAGVGKSGIEAVTGAKPEVVIAGHEWTHPMEFKVAGPLEHAYEKLVLDHTMPGGDLSQNGIVLNQVDATRALNEAANLVRLTEGHATAGISLERFNSAFSYDAVTKVLKIIDPKEAQSIINDLHTHSGGISLSGAEKFAGNVDWHDKVQALDMHEVEPGVGHPEVTDNQIGEMPKPFHPVDAVREEVLSKYDEFLNRPPISDTLESPQNTNWLDRAETTTVTPPAENNILDPNDPMFQEHMAGATEGKLDPLRDVYNDMTRVWTPDDAETAFNDNIHNLFPPPKGLSLLYNNNWILVKNSLATDVLNTPVEANDAFFGPIIPYIHRLQEVTGLKPHGANWLRAGETVSKYILRATQKAAEMGTEAMQKIRVK